MLPEIPKFQHGFSSLWTETHHSVQIVPISFLLIYLIALYETWSYLCPFHKHSQGAPHLFQSPSPSRMQREWRSVQCPSGHLMPLDCYWRAVALMGVQPEVLGGQSYWMLGERRLLWRWAEDSLRFEKHRWRADRHLCEDQALCHKVNNIWLMFEWSLVCQRHTVT